MRTSRAHPKTKPRPKWYQGGLSQTFADRTATRRPALVKHRGWHVILCRVQQTVNAFPAMSFSDMNSRNLALVLSAVAFVIFAVPVPAAQAQTASSEIPANARANSYGSGWECVSGFRNNGGQTCEQIAVPENAYLSGSTFGRGWVCARGYRERGTSCEPIEIPANAYLSASGTDWNCERGFLKKRNACAEVQVPENAYLDETAFRTGWKCLRGFRESGNRCSPISVPANAHLNYTGNGWDCDRPFQRTRDTCRLP